MTINAVKEANKTLKGIKSVYIRKYWQIQLLFIDLSCFMIQLEDYSTYLPDWNKKEKKKALKRILK